MNLHKIVAPHFEAPSHAYAHVHYIIILIYTHIHTYIRIILNAVNQIHCVGLT